MPTLRVNISVSASADAKKAFLQELSPQLASLTGKAEKWIFISLIDNVAMIFAGSDAPAAECTLCSIGGINHDANNKLCGAITAALDKHFKIPADRVYSNYNDYKAENWAWNGKTFG